MLCMTAGQLRTECVATRARTRVWLGCGGQWSGGVLQEAQRRRHVHLCDKPRTTRCAVASQAAAHASNAADLEVAAHAAQLQDISDAAHQHVYEPLRIVVVEGDLGARHSAAICWLCFVPLHRGPQQPLCFRCMERKRHGPHSIDPQVWYKRKFCCSVAPRGLLQRTAVQRPHEILLARACAVCQRHGSGTREAQQLQHDTRRCLGWFLAWLGRCVLCCMQLHAGKVHEPLQATVVAARQSLCQDCRRCTGRPQPWSSVHDRAWRRRRVARQGVRPRFVPGMSCARASDSAYAITRVNTWCFDRGVRLACAWFAAMKHAGLPAELCGGAPRGGAAPSAQHRAQYMADRVRLGARPCCGRACPGCCVLVFARSGDSRFARASAQGHSTGNAMVPRVRSCASMRIGAQVIGQWVDAHDCTQASCCSGVVLQRRADAPPHPRRRAPPPPPIRAVATKAPAPWPRAYALPPRAPRVQQDDHLV